MGDPGLLKSYRNKLSAFIKLQEREWFLPNFPVDINGNNLFLASNPPPALAFSLLYVNCLCQHLPGSNAPAEWRSGRYCCLSFTVTWKTFLCPAPLSCSSEPLPASAFITLSVQVPLCFLRHLTFLPWDTYSKPDWSPPPLLLSATFPLFQFPWTSAFLFIALPLRIHFSA